MKRTFGLLWAMIGSASAATTWFYGASNNSANYGVTADNYQAIQWHDAWAGGTDKDASYYNSWGVQVNRPDQFGEGQSICMFGFDGTGLTASQVTSASLYLREDYAFYNGEVTGPPNTWQIVGIAAGNANWDTGAMTWNDLDGAGGSGDWTGGSLGNSLINNYGTFQDLGTNVDGNLVLDVTQALKDYLNGTISGIAFVNATNGDTFNALDYAATFYSDNNATATNRPGLLVNTNTVPEPSIALLSGFGVMMLVRRRRY